MNDTTLYDVVIIGGGLAGLSLAIQCAGAGYATILFEKEEYPFHKVCGEYISNESVPFLQRLGVPLQQYHLPQINTLHLTDVIGNLYPFPLDLGGFGISRFTLDNLLYQTALKKGAVVKTGTKVQDVQFANDRFTALTSAGNFTARIACGAYGKRSNLDVKWKRAFTLQKSNQLNNYIGIKYHIQHPHPNSVIALHNFKNGYCGISKIEEDKCCLCYLTTAANLKKHNSSIAQMEGELLSQNPQLKAIFSGAAFLYQQPLAISQISFEPKTQVENGILMLGDTAGLIAPLCGNGMSMAMHASLLAFLNIDLFLQKKVNRPQMEMQYAKEWKARFSKRLLAGRLIQQVFGGNTTTALFLKTMDALPRLANAIIKLTHGRTF
ncbi:FAD-binding protein [Ilyomonas limi]|uniref:FAD-binding protein n=1 Tax=Ilyomonas limi TaxID=2575867 RepID=A0A4U3L8Q6_9BACT|nr:FAD-binding protein [Ilyomonas limi]TKK70296.1 FAD-binding protein [Ilyomonas limi]